MYYFSYFIFSNICIFYLSCYAFWKKFNDKTKTSLNSVGLEILKENWLIFNELDLLEEITKANKMNEQENMTKNLKVELEDNKYDKYLKQNLYLYGAKNIDYNDLKFKGGDKGYYLRFWREESFQKSSKKEKNWICYRWFRWYIWWW